MKKLMIAAAVVLAGIAANAATINWTVDLADLPGSTDDYSVPMDGYYGYLLVDSVSGAGAGSYAGQTFLLADAQEAVANGNVSFLSTYALADANGNIATAFSDTAATSKALGFDSGTEVFANNTDVKAYLIITDADKPADATKAFILAQGFDEDGNSYDATTSINGSGGSDAVKFGQAWYATEDPSGWQTVGAPEPTSGLLLLLGVAGLALKRKRA